MVWGNLAIEGNEKRQKAALVKDAVVPMVVFQEVKLGRKWWALFA
jgi:hypothetical protein